MASQKKEVAKKAGSKGKQDASVTTQSIDEAKKNAQPEKTARKDTSHLDYPRYRIEPGQRIKLADINPDESEDYKTEKQCLKELEKQRERISELQERLFAEEHKSLLIILQAMDAGGKDGVGRGVFCGVNPQGCQIWSFKSPSEEEKKQDFLWRFHQKVPEQGMIAIFNRSYYEEVLSHRVKGEVPEEVWRRRYEDINNFEKMLSSEGITIIKFYLHISKDEQKLRLEERLTNSKKFWLFSENDINERARWDAHMQAFEDAIENCSTEYAPWYVLPGNKKWYRNLVIARTIADTLEVMDPQYPALEEGMENMVVPD